MKHLLLIIITAFFCSQVSAQITLERSDWSSTYISGGRNGFRIISTVGELRINENTIGQTHLSEGFISPGIKSVVSTINDETNSFVIYPNPTTGIFKIYLDEETLKKAKNIRIFNDIGQLVYDKTLKNEQEEYTVDISRLPKGIYFVTIALSNKKMITKKMIKQ